FTTDPGDAARQHACVPPEALRVPERLDGRTSAVLGTAGTSGPPDASRPLPDRQAGRRGVGPVHARRPGRGRRRRARPLVARRRADPGGDDAPEPALTPSPVVQSPSGGSSTWRWRGRVGWWAGSSRSTCPIAELISSP